MKRVFAVLMIVLLCTAMVVSASADTFTPSVTNKPAPELVPAIDPDGNPHPGYIMDDDGKILDYLDEGCLVITPVSKAETSNEIPADSKETLLYVYEQLTSGKMTMPYHLHNPNYDSDDMVIRDLFDATFLCGEHPKMLEPTGVMLVLTFDIGVKADEDVSVMTYKNGAWGNIVKITNNGDGTVTCVFEHLCPIAFSVPTGNTPPSQTGDIPTVGIMGFVALAALLAIAVLTVLYIRSTKKASN